MDTTSLGRIGPVAQPVSVVNAPGDAGRLFLVERRLPGVTDRRLAILQNALIQVTARFAEREDELRYLWSIFMPGQQRLLSLFASVSLDLVRAANEASLFPFIGIEAVTFLVDPAQGPGV